MGKNLKAVAISIKLHDQLQEYCKKLNVSTKGYIETLILKYPDITVDDVNKFSPPVDKVGSYMHCSFCKETGHNLRTCPNKTEEKMQKIRDKLEALKPAPPPPVRGRLCRNPFRKQPKPHQEH